MSLHLTKRLSKAFYAFLLFSVAALSLPAQNELMRVFNPGYTEVIPLITDSLYIQDRMIKDNHKDRFVGFVYDAFGPIREEHNTLTY